MGRMFLFSGLLGVKVAAMETRVIFEERLLSGGGGGGGGTLMTPRTSCGHMKEKADLVELLAW